MRNLEKESTDGRGFIELCKHSFGTPKDRKNQKQFMYWMVIWALTLLASSWLLKGDYLSSPFSWLIAIFPTVLGLGGLFAYIRFIRDADELIQKIELEGLAIGFGVGVLFVIGYPLLEQAGLPAISAPKTGAVMLFAWVFGQINARRRYQ
jgi:hypothetical protein